MDEIKTKLGQVIKKLFGVEIQVELTVAPEETGADYATNVAMKLAKVAHKAPMMIAEEIKTEVDGGEFKVEIAAPGFMNFTLSDEYFAEKAKEGIIPSDEYSGKTVVAEFSDPNPFKVLHVGHLYTSIVGDSISRLLEFAGARVIRANFGGDVGLHVGKTLYALLRSNYSFGDINIEDIAKCYVEGTRAYEEDEMAKAEITKLNKEIYAIAELGEEKSMERLELEKLAEDFEVATEEMAKVAQLYWLGRRLSYEYFEQFYDSIGVKFDKYYPESTVADRGLKEVREHVGTVYEESEGAVVFRGEKVGLHTRVFINREGIPTYETKDVGLIFTKWADWHFDESVVITGNEQSDYMKVVLASVKEYAPELVERTRHLTHGLVKLPGNVKMSSRKGNFLKAVDVIELVEATLLDSSASADALLTHRTSSTARSATPASLSNPNTEASKNSMKITLAAIKYAFLKYKMGGDIIFDPKESVSTTGNSGVYLLYSAVRAKKILEKTGKESDLNKKVVQDVDAEEQRYVRKLNKKIVQYREVLAEAVKEKAPYKVCAYLYELAQEFSRFYEHVKVVGSEREAELRGVVEIYAGVMEHGLGLLGIEVPEEM